MKPQDLPEIIQQLNLFFEAPPTRTSVCSVYFDSEDYELYHQRIRQREGAKLLRVRWYQGRRDTVVLERKVHHEGWTGASSVKERAKLTVP